MSSIRGSSSSGVKHTSCMWPVEAFVSVILLVIINPSVINCVYIEHQQGLQSSG